jgi:hypothetical protein
VKSRPRKYRARKKCPVPFARNSPFGSFAQKIPDTNGTNCRPSLSGNAVASGLRTLVVADIPAASADPRTKLVPFVPDTYFLVAPEQTKVRRSQKGFSGPGSPGDSHGLLMPTPYFAGFHFTGWLLGQSTGTAPTGRRRASPFARWNRFHYWPR